MIKFRAWHKELKYMMQVSGLVYCHHNKVWDVHGADEQNKFEYFTGDNIELMQSTGIQDLLNNEIFEGDILTHDHGGGVESCVIERNPDDNQLHVRYLYMPGYNTDYLGEAPLQGSIVVGNRWNNPELMKGDDE